MVKFDSKDKKILYHLKKNSRQSYSSIGKKVGLYRKNVINRVNKLIEHGVIYSFYTLIDLQSLGYDTYRFYFNFQYLTPEIKKKIVNELVADKNSTWITTLGGQYDFALYIAVKDIFDFYPFWSKFYDKYRYYFSNVSFAIRCLTYFYDLNFLIDDRKMMTDKSTEILKKGRLKINIDSLDQEILKMISTNPRMKTIDIADELDITSITVAKRFKKLEKNQIIDGYGIDINFQKLGFTEYRLDIDLMDTSLKNKVHDYILDNAIIQLRYISIGDAADLEYEIIIQNVNQLHNLMVKISNKIPNSIKNYRYHYTVLRHKGEEIIY